MPGSRRWTLTTARTIGGVSFDGSANANNYTLPTESGNRRIGNLSIDTTGSAATLTTARDGGLTQNHFTMHCKHQSRWSQCCR